MTVTAELLKTSQRLEYILCIEGMGWTTQQETPASGFDGDVFVTTDLDSGLAALLGCTIHKTLVPKSSIESSVNPLSCAVSFGGMSFDIIDDGYLLANVTPFKSTTVDYLDANLNFFDTTLQSVNGSYSEGDVVWVGGCEAVLLGPKAGTDYSACTRGYLGTRRGRNDYRNIGITAMAFGAGILFQNVNRFWANRLMRLYAHVPGEAASACSLLWQGKLTSCVIPQSGIVWAISGTGDILGHGHPIRQAPDLVILGNQFSIKDAFLGATDFLTGSLAGNGGNVDDRLYSAYNRALTIGSNESGTADTDSCKISNGWMCVKALFQYRTEPGGTDGILAAWSSGADIQALEKTDQIAVSNSLIAVGGSVVRLLYGLGQSVPGVISWNLLISEVTGDWAGQYNLSLFENGTPARWLLDNHSDDPELSRFAINHNILRNPIDVALCFLTSMNGEYARADAEAGGTQTTIEITGEFGVSDQWNGYALHCVEGLNKGYARVITDSVVAGGTTTLTVSPGFPDAPVAGNEYQIRNSIYDVLPITWGCCKHNAQIDIAAFELIRDKYIPEAELGRFAIGYENKIDLWEMITKKILAPYGIAIVLDRTSGKLSPAFIGDAIGDGIDQDYLAVGKKQIISVGDMNLSLADSISTIALKVRQSWAAVVQVPLGYSPKSLLSGNGYVLPEGYNPYAMVYDLDPMSGKTTLIEIQEKGFTDAQTEAAKTIFEVDGTFNTEQDANSLISAQIARIKLLSTPRPTVPMMLDISLLPYVKEGTIISLTYADAPVNPFTGVRGWSGLAARVLGMSIPFASELGFNISVEILDDLSGGRIAPAAIVSEVEYVAALKHFHVNENDIAYNDGTIKDMHYFEVGDYVALYRASGLLVQNCGTIASFGTDQKSDPTLAANHQINTSVGLATTDLVVFVGAADGVNAYSLLSTDLAVTFAETNNPKNFDLFFAEYGNSIFVCGGVSDGVDSYLLTSPDGSAFTERANPKAMSLYGAHYFNGRWVLCGQADGADGYLLTSDDNCATFTERANPKNFAIRAVIHGTNNWIFVGDADGTNSYTATSFDAVTWTETSNPKNFILYGIAKSTTGRIVAVGEADGADAYIVYSDNDGLAWTEVANPKNFTLRSIVYADGIFIAVGFADGVDAYLISSSDNGATWTEHANPANVNLRSITYVNKVLIACGDNSGGDAYIITASISDLDTWTEIANAKNFTLYGVAAMPVLQDGDYLTFQEWDTAQTTRMDKYAAQADDATQLLDAADAAKEYV